MRILLVEDEPRAAQMLSKGLREQSYAVDVAGDGQDALYQAAITDYDAIILDVMLPGIDGFEVCRQLRRSGTHVPVLMLTARDAVESRISGLDSGADDYLIKPFDFGELLARLRAVIRRGRLPLDAAPSSRSAACGSTFAPARRFRRDRAIKLTSREFALLEFLVLHAGEVVGRGAIAEHVWDAPFESMSNVIDVMIQRLRRKIDDPHGPSLITTRRGEGYMLAPVSRRVRRIMTLSIRARLTLWYSSRRRRRAGDRRRGRRAARSRGWPAAAGRRPRAHDGDARGRHADRVRRGADAGGGRGRSQRRSRRADRTLVLTRADGSLLAVWGLPLRSAASSRRQPSASVDHRSHRAGDVRVLEPIGRSRRASLRAPSSSRRSTPLHAQHAEMVRAMVVGVAIALVAAARRRLGDRTTDAASR